MPPESLQQALERAGVGSTIARSIGLAARLSGQRRDLSEIATIALHTNPEMAVADPMFNEANFITLAASAVNSVVVTFTPPANTLGILTEFAQGIGNQADYDLITWRLRVGPGAIPGFDAITGPIAPVFLPIKIFWPIFAGQKVEVVATNLSATAIANVTALVRGTFFPRA